MRRHLPTLLLAVLAGGALAAGVARLLGLATLSVRLLGEDWTLLSPERLYLLTGVPLLAWGATLSLADLPRAQRWLGTLSRMALCTILVLAVARPARTTESSRVSTIFLVDVSDSMTDAALARARQRLDEALRERDEGDVQLVTFAEDARAVPLAEGAPATLDRHPGRGMGSNLAGALQLAYGLFPPGHLRRAVLISDGGQTRGDLLSEARRASTLGVRLHVLPSREGVPEEVAVHEVELPTAIRVGEPFRVRARVFSTRATSARLRLYQGETINGLGGIRDVELAAGENDVDFDSIVRVAGPVTYRLEVAPSGADRFAANNGFESSAVVPGRPAVLYVEGAEGRGTHLARALTAADLEVDVRGPRAIPTSLRELERFDFFILSDVSADQVSVSQMDAIERYVRDVGGGFVMAGGERAFGLGGWQGSRMEELLPVRMDSERRRDQPSLALALVMDRSGSMAGQAIELAKEAAKATAQLLGPDDYISVIGFDSRPERVVRMQSAQNRMQILRDIGRLGARGGTAIFPALDMAYQDLSVTRARVKHVILLTDGQAPEQGISELVQVMRAEAMTVTTVGLGADVNRALLQSIANLGGGRSYFTNDPHNVPRIFMRETTTVARSAAVEEYFRPIETASADFLRGVPLASAPYLHGYVATRPKPSPAQVVLTSELGEPILARWRVGLGWALAWTSDVKNRWAVDWLRWPGFSRFWAQLVREHMRERRAQTLDMRATLEGGDVRVVVDAIGDDDRFLNGLESTVVVAGPLGGRDARGAGSAAPSAVGPREEHPLRQTAPGRYEARFPLDRYGSFVLTATHLRDGRPVAESSAHLSHPYPEEYRRLAPDEPLLREAARVSGGIVDPSTATLLDPGDETIPAHEELWVPLLFAALGLFLVDLLLRRVRLFDRAFQRH